MRELLQEAAAFLRSHGVEDDRAEAEILLSGALGVDRALLSTLDAVPVEAEGRFQSWIRRRARERVPTAYLLGRAEFYGMELRVTPDVLIPRPETEILVERAIELRPARFLDIGTGSGAIAVALAKRGGSGVATDTSAAALEVAAENARRHGVADRIDFREQDLFADGDFDLVLSNPPYVSASEYPNLAPEVRHEPRSALVAGADGLEAIRRILLAGRGPLLLEVGAGQAEAATEIALQSGFRDVRWWRDLSGISRVLEAR